MRQERVGQRRDAALAQVAARQHGVITLAQLRRVGVGSDALKRGVAAVRLYRIFRGVYAVGHDGLGNEGKWMAAVLACAGAPRSATAVPRSCGGCSTPSLARCM
jgi:predicted transcriptional regulator of viral defense system